MVKLSIINPNTISEPYIYVDKYFIFEKEIDFNESKIEWKFYGMPYEHIPMSDGSVQTKYGFEYAFGYVENILNSDLRFDIIYGFLIERLDIDDTNENYSDSDSNFE